MYKYHTKTDRNFFNIIKFTNKLNFPYSRIQIVIKSKDLPQKLSSKKLLFRRCSIISSFSYLDWLDHASSLKDLVKIVRNESDLSYKQIWKERSRSRIPWIYRESDQPRSKLPRIYRKSNQPRPKLPWIYRKSDQPRHKLPWNYRKSDQPRPRLPWSYRKSDQPRHKLPWIYRKSNQTRPKSPLRYSKLDWSSFRPLSGKLTMIFSDYN